MIVAIFMELEFSRHIFQKYSNIKFHENPSSGSRVVPRGRTDRAKLNVTVLDFANAPGKSSQRPALEYRIIGRP